MEDTDQQSDPPDGADRPARRRRGWRTLAVGLAVLLALPVLLAIGAVWWLGWASLALPAAAEARIEARLNAMMTANLLQLGGVEVGLPDGLSAPVVRLIGVVMTDPDGTPRAAFPEVTVVLSGAALARGEMRPTEVAVSRAGLRLSRDEAGRFDIALSTVDTAAEVSLAETLARIDTMFAAPEFAELEVVTGSALELAMGDEMTGQVMRVRDAQMRLVREDGTLTLTIGGALEGSRDATLDIALNRSATAGRSTLGFAFTNLAARDLATAAPALAWLDLMRAPISGFLSGQLGDDGTVGDMRATLQIGPGQLSIEGATTPLRFETLETALAFEAATGRLQFEHLDLQAPELSFAANGHADVSPEGTVYTGQFRLSEIAADPRGMFEAPLDLEGAVLDLRLTLEPQLLVEIGQVVFFDGPLRASARGRIQSREEGLDVSIDAHLREAHSSQVFDYWPLDRFPQSRRWLDENLRDGRILGVDFSLRQAAGDPAEMSLGLDFEEAEVVALRAMPPITGGVGYLSVVGPRVIVRVDDGQMLAPDGGAVSLAGSTMVIDDARVPGPGARFDLATSGALRDHLRLLRLPPVRLLESGPLTQERLGTGQARLRGVLETRLQRQEGMGGTQFDVRGEVTGYVAETLVPGHRLGAERLQVEVDNSRVTVSGQAMFDGVPVTGQWARALGPGSDPISTVEARARVDRAGLGRFGVSLPLWLMDGETSVDLSLRMPPEDAATLEIESDLRGVRMAIPPLGWQLGTQQPGRLSAEIRLGPTPQVPSLSIDAAGLSLSGRISVREDGTLDRITAQRFSLGAWMDVTGALIGRGANRMPEIEITGGTVDLRGAPQRQGNGANEPDGPPLTATLDRFQVSEGIALTGMRAELITEGGLSGQFRGRINGEAEVTGTLVTTEDGPAVRVRSDDGGGALRAAGIFGSAYGGEMELILRATGQEGNYDGILDISGPRLRDAPAMAELLNLISVVGLLEQLGGEGINLGDVDAQFRLTPTRLILQQGTAVGPSLGISLDGVYTLGSGELDMQGVVSPLYVVNGLIGALFAPRREGLFGFAYRLTGTSDATQVTVNPLSILTPGIFREIFRRPPPDLTDAP